MLKLIKNKVIQIKNKVIQNFKKNKKTLFVFFGVFALLFLIVFSYINLNNPTWLNKLLANASVPANSAFSSNELYNAIVKEYNTENNTSYAYTTKLTDEQLQTIKTLKINNKTLTSTNGIEKLTNIETLWIKSGRIRSIDLSNNTKLVDLDLSYNILTSLDISNNVSLETLNVSSNYLDELDVSNNTIITKLTAENNNISEIDLSNNNLLQEINFASNSFETFVLVDNSNIKNILLNKNPLEIINISGSTSLINLYLNDCMLNNVDFSTNLNIQVLEIKNNYLNSLDLHNNNKLSKIIASNNNISNVILPTNHEASSLVLDLSYNLLSSVPGLNELTALEKLNLNANKIESVDISNLINLTEVYIAYNKLSEIDASNNTKIKSLGVIQNNLSSIKLYSKRTYRKWNTGHIDYIENNLVYKLQHNKLSNITVYRNDADSYGGEQINNIYNMTPDNEFSLYISDYITIPSEITAREFINKLHLKVNDNDIFIGDEEELSTTDGGILIYDNNGNQITSANSIIKNEYRFTWKLHNELISSKIYVFQNDYFDDPVFYEKVLKTFDSEKTIDYSMSLDELNTIKKLNISNVLIRSTKGIEKLTNLTECKITYSQIDSIDLSHASNLEKLILYNNQLTSLNLSNFTNLKTLKVEYNNLKTINLNNNISLNEIDLNNNMLSSIDLSSSGNVNIVNLSNNKLSNIDVSQNPNLGSLNVQENKLKNLDITSNSLLISIYANNNFLKAIDISNNLNITNFHVSNNRIKTITSSDNNINLKNCLFDINYIQNNPFNSNQCIWDFTAYNNPLILNDFAILNGKSKSYNLGSITVDDETIAKYDSNYVQARKVGITNYYNPIYNMYAKIIVYDIKSDVYTVNTLNNPYIYVGSEYDDDAILSNINIEGIEDNLTYKINGDVLEIYYDNKVVSTIDIIRIKSNKFDLSINFDNKKYIVLDNDDINLDDKNQFDYNCNYCWLSMNKNHDNTIINFYSSGSLIDTWEIININSIKYDVNKNYIYVGSEYFNPLYMSAGSADIIEKNEAVTVNIGDNVIKSWDIVGIYSSKYNMNKKYIYVKNKELNLNKINCINSSCTIEDGKLVIKYNNDVVDTKEIVSISSSKYDLENKKIKKEYKKQFNINDIHVVNANLLLENNKLILKKGEDILDEFSIYERLKGDANNDDNISISDITKMYKYIKGKNIKLTDEDMAVMDVNDDGKVTLSDISKIYKYINQKINNLD